MIWPRIIICFIKYLRRRHGPRGARRQAGREYERGDWAEVAGRLKKGSGIRRGKSGESAMEGLSGGGGKDEKREWNTEREVGRGCEGETECRKG